MPSLPVRCRLTALESKLRVSVIMRYMRSICSVSLANSGSSPTGLPSGSMNWLYPIWNSAIVFKKGSSKCHPRLYNGRSTDNAAE